MAPFANRSDGSLPIRVVRYDGPGLSFEMHERAAARRLDDIVAGPYVGWRESSAGVMRRREMPSGIVPLILNFAEPYCVIDPRDPAGIAYPRGTFLAGLHETYAITESRGQSFGLQVNFTPLGARQIFGVAMHTLTNRVLEAEDVLGGRARRWVERLQSAPTLSERFCLLDEFLAARLGSLPPALPAVAWAWRQLAASGGTCAISTLAREIGWSHRHFIARFREQIGLAPKTAARVLRFDRARRALERRLANADDPRWAEIAQDCGYYDQAHLIRDFAEFAGSTPTELLRLRLPSGGGVRAE